MVGNVTYPPPQGPFSNPDLFGGAQGMFGGLRRGFRAGGQALHPYSNRLMLAGLGMLGGGPKEAMRGLVAGSALDTEDADRRKLNKALQALQNDPDSQLFAGMSQPEIDIISSDKDTFGAFIANRTKPADSPNSWDEYVLTTDTPTSAGYNAFLDKKAASNRITLEQGGKFSDWTALRKDFESQPGVTGYRTSIPKLNSMAASVYDTSKMSDFQFVYGMAQIFDPTSIVRGEEGQMVIDSQSIPAQIKGQMEALLNSKAGIGTQGRTDLVATAKRRVDEYRKQAEEERKFFENIAIQNEIDPTFIVRPLEPMSEIGAAGDTPFTVEP